MKIIVIEDEVDILKGIQEVIEQSGLPFEQVFAVHTAEEALTVIEQCRPEIILTDILLPEMSGLDMLESVKAFGYQPKVVVISSYSNFMYAQRSIQLGAVDYILKPAQKEELIEKIGSVYDMVQRERISADQIKNQMAYARLGTEALKEKFVLGLCMHKTALQEHIHHRLQVWDLQWLETHSYVVISLSINKDEFRGKEDKDINLDLFAIGNIAEDIMMSYQPSVMIRSIHHDWVILTAWEQEQDVAQDIHDRVLKYQKIKPAIGISPRMHSFQAISVAYEQARKALKIAILNSSNRIVSYSDITDRMDEENDVRISQWVAEAVLDGDDEAVRRWLGEAMERFMLDRDVSKTGDLSIKCFEWILEVHSSLAEKVDMEISHFPMELWEKAERCPTVDDLKLLLQEHLSELMKLVLDQQQPSHPNYMIDKAKRIIEAKYGEEVTLQSVADELNIHPVWLSRLFKKETGQNFLDYLTEIRIEQAKQLLRGTNLKIYEIAEKIGYHEIQYFGKLFKKRTNMTPKEFRYGK
ncbi:response regulator [Paenibacillus sedimenti]|uniref:Response regulator n=1 Tax=Paenibacillus sedimenti TaxID=2770274 RepID=A0A926QHS9_9BACL|nr:response regulator [Paenibacillus sedimenti]MBD0378849.1 response regulator [Paenibacillus sedimenti]